MNSPQTPLFDKSRVLYGLDLAREAIHSSDATVIVEGYVDVLIAHQYGFRNVVAPLGTALTGGHVNILKKISRNIYLALDADPAGIRATLKGVQTLGESPDGALVAITSPQGIIGWQRELHEVIKIIALPDGKDPDEVIQTNPDQWRALVAGAQPAMDFYIRALTSDLDLRSGKGKSEAVARLAPLLVDLRAANEVEYAHYIHLIARLIEIEEQAIERALPAPQRMATRPQTAAAARVAALTPSHEDHMLGWLLRYPAARTAVQEKTRRDLSAFPLVGEIIQGTPLELFERVDNRAIWQAWLEQPPGTNPEEWARTLDESLREQAERVLNISVPQPQAYRYVNDALECATILQTELARRWRIRIKHQISQTEDPAEQAQALERLVQIESYIGMLNIPKRSSAYDDLHTLHTV
jgi:DNA primase